MNFIISGRVFHKTRRDVESARREGDVVYFSNKHNAYYIKNEKAWSQEFEK